MAILPIYIEESLLSTDLQRGGEVQNNKNSGLITTRLCLLSKFMHFLPKVNLSKTTVKSRMYRIDLGLCLLNTLLFTFSSKQAQAQ